MTVKSLLFLVTLSPYPLPGGLTTRMNALAKQLCNHKIDVKIISPLFCGTISSSEDVNAISPITSSLLLPIVQLFKAYRLFTLIPLSLLCFLRLLREAPSRKAVALFMDSLSFLPALYAKLFLRAVIIGDDICFRHNQYGFPLRFLVKAYETIVVKCSNVIATSFTLDYKVIKKMRKEKNTIFVANGVELKQSKEVEYERKNWKRIMFLYKGGKRMEMEYMLHVADLLCNEFNDVQIWAVGCDRLPESYLNRESVLSGLVKICGYVTQEKLTDLYERAAIGILPDFGDLAHTSQRTKTLEYFANGLLVVSSKEDLKGFKGLLPGIHCVAVSSPEEMANALKDIIRYPDRFIKMAEMGKQFVAENYTWEAVTKDYIELIKGLVENSVSSTRCGRK